MNKTLSKLGPLTLPAAYCLAMLALFSASRLLGTFLFHSRIPTEAEHLKILLIGLRIDLATVCYQTLLLSVVFLCFPKKWVVSARYAVAPYVAGMAGLSLFLELATPSFISEFGLRPNQLLLEHVREPREILQTVFADHLIELFGSLALLAVCTWLAVRFALDRTRDYRPWDRRKSLWAAPLVLLLLVLGARGRLFKGPPMGLSVAEFSNISLVNQLTLNSTYSFGYALTQLRFEASPLAVYRLEMPEAEVLARVKAGSTAKPEDFIGDDSNPLLHREHSRVSRRRPLNFVIFLEESLGAEYVGSLGGLPLTPRLDALAKEGVLFTRLYSTGTRSARGIEAVLSGFLPTPGESTIKLGRSQVDFFTVARLLRDRGYHTTFLYGGDSNFDNMRTFALNNGFQEIIDQRDFAAPVLRGVWGVSDEDVMRRADAHFDGLGGRPFFTLVFTTSNHAPFEFPDGRITPYEQPKATVHNTVKYADYALGLFFDLARKRRYFDRTAFLIVADHNYRNFGSGLVPVDKMHIPGVLIAPGLEPSRYDKPASQIDLAPTVLPLMGIDTVHPMIGDDLFARPKDHPGRAIMQFGLANAYLCGDRVVILQPDRSIRHFLYRDELLQPATESDPELVRDAIAHALLPGYLYQNRKYH